MAKNKESKRAPSLLDDEDEVPRKKGKKKKSKDAEKPAKGKKKKKKKLREVSMEAAEASLTDLLETQVAKSLGSLEDAEEEADDLDEEDDVGEEDDSDVEETDGNEEESEEEEEEEGEEADSESDAEDEDAAEDAEEEEEEEALDEEEADSERDAAGKRGLITVPFTRCTNCSHLVSHAKRRIDHCHYTNGNERCPAKGLVIVRGMDTESVAQKLFRAFRDNDMQEDLRIRNVLVEKYDPIITGTVMARLQALIKEYTLSEITKPDVKESVAPAAVDRALSSEEPALDVDDVDRAELAIEGDVSVDSNVITDVVEADQASNHDESDDSSVI